MKTNMPPVTPFDHPRAVRAPMVPGTLHVEQRWTLSHGNPYDRLTWATEAEAAATADRLRLCECGSWHMPGSEIAKRHGVKELAQ
ncbi:MAG: hypothetical protein NTV51_02775 [Verrucomicrobia bacterium]|nr:hypothetical protein [Verrucomicrobiota bacterium]